MNEWLRGIIVATLLLALGYVIYTISISSSPDATVGAVVCTGISLTTLLALTYAIEEDNFLAGLIVPFLVAAILVIGYFTDVPFPDAAYAIILAQFLGLAFIPESD